MLKPVHGEDELPIYKIDTYRGREEDEWKI